MWVGYAHDDDDSLSLSLTALRGTKPKCCYILLRIKEEAKSGCRQRYVWDNATVGSAQMQRRMGWVGSVAGVSREGRLVFKLGKTDVRHLLRL